ncbi:hypothetical protein BKA62DRAFT_707393 [Auriculariales sp. MPI-PUGE-AT-0066]|nr:hypothetical protein BKA62DRAFT_707393 [Auriculariales sp. MPI-PUGE-AT-0066]
MQRRSWRLWTASCGRRMLREARTPLRVLETQPTGAGGGMRWLLSRPAGIGLCVCTRLISPAAGVFFSFFPFLGPAPVLAVSVVSLVCLMRIGYFRH